MDCKCSACGSGCSSGCGGCQPDQTLYLTAEECDLLRGLGQIPFAPLARRPDGETPVALVGTHPSDAILALRGKGLVSLDWDLPLTDFDYSQFPGYQVYGSMALTARGQQALELLEIQGISE